MFPPLRLREAWNFGGLTLRQVLVRTWTKMNEHEIFTRAAAVSFYAMLALVPMLAIVLTALVQLLPDITGMGGKSVGIGNITVAQLQNTLRQALPEEGYKVVEEQIKRMQKDPPFGLLSIGLIIALWTASSLYLAIIDSLNRVYGVTETRSFVKLRLVAIAMTLIQAVILLGALIAIVAGPEILRWMGFRGSVATIALGLQWVVVVVMVLLSFALTFYVGPDAQQRWEWITPGSVLGTAAFLAFTWLFRVYIQHFANYDKTYGSLGGVMVLLFWFWVSSLVLLGAAQLNKVIEDASPLGKAFGQKEDKTQPPNLSELKPQPLS
ncbi:MAG: putative rane protein [Planctomycetota bacterium]|nr:putative rane protein [Planctomycetota bacterium]